MPLGPVDEASCERYAALGVDRLVLRPEAWEPGASGDPDGIARFLERHAHLGEWARWRAWARKATFTRRQS